MKGKIVRCALTDEAIALGVNVPAYATPGSAGIDLQYAGDDDVFIAPDMSAKLPTGVIVEIPQGYVGMVLPRSSMSAIGVPAEVGVIDSDYRGELHIVLTNVGDSVRMVYAGARIAQLVLIPCLQATIVQASRDDLSQTVRGTGGFGSTGR